MEEQNSEQQMNYIYQMYHQSSQQPQQVLIPPPQEEPICKRLPKRKCVLELEKIKSSLVEPEMVIYEPPKKPMVRAGCFGRRRGRPPSKPRACNYVFTTQFINFCSMLISNGLTDLSIIDFHKQFFKPFTPLSPESLNNALLKLEQYKNQLTNNNIQQPMIQSSRNPTNNIQPYVQTNNYNMNYARMQNVPQNQYINNYTTPVSQNYVDNRYPISYPQNYLLQMTSNMISNNSNSIHSTNQPIQYQNIRQSQPMVYNVNPVCQTTYLQEQTQRLAGRSLQEAYNTNPIYMKQYTGSANR